MNNNNRVQEPTFLSLDNLFYRLSILEEKQNKVQSYRKQEGKDFIEEEYEDVDAKYGYTSRKSR